MEPIQIITNPNEFKKEIANEIIEHLDDFLKHYIPKLPNEYLTRKEVAQMFNVDLSTIHNWTKAKTLNPLGLGSRVYFLRSEIEACLKPLNS